MHFKSGNAGQLKMLHNCIRDIKNTEVIIKYPRFKGDLSIVGFCDAALHNMDDKVSSGGGYVIFLVDKDLRSAPISWSRTKIKRVVRSSLAAEALIAVDCADRMYYV